MKNLIIAFTAMICLISCKKKSPSKPDSMGTYSVFNAGSTTQTQFEVEVDSTDPSSTCYAHVVTASTDITYTLPQVSNGVYELVIQVPISNIRQYGIYINSNRYDYHLMGSLHIN